MTRRKQQEPPKPPTTNCVRWKSAHMHQPNDRQMTAATTTVAVAITIAANITSPAPNNERCLTLVVLVLCEVDVGQVVVDVLVRHVR